MCESVCNGIEPLRHPFIIARAVPRIVGKIKHPSSNICQQECRRQCRYFITKKVYDGYFSNFFPVFDLINATVADIQNGRVDEVVTIVKTIKKSVVGKVQFVFGTSVRQFRQLIWKSREVSVRTIDVQSGIMWSMDADTSSWTAICQLTNKEIEIRFEGCHDT